MMPSVQFFPNLDTVAGKLKGGTLAYKNRKSDTKIPNGFGLGTPPPLETSAARSHNRLSLDSRAPGIAADATPMSPAEQVALRLSAARSFGIVARDLLSVWVEPRVKVRWPLADLEFFSVSGKKKKKKDSPDYRKQKWKKVLGTFLDNEK